MAEYDIVAHFHTKKSLTVEWGDRWRRHILGNLLGSPASVQSIIEQLTSESLTGVIFSSPYPLIADYLDWGGMRDRIGSILRDRLGVNIGLTHGKPTFPVGNMFWARGKAIRSVLSHCWTWGDFEEESGQLAGTLGHCIERIWCLVSEASGFVSKEVLMRDIGPDFQLSRRRRLAVFVHYAQGPTISQADLYYIHHLCGLTDRLVVVSNSPIDDASQRALRPYTDLVIVRANLAADFGAWSRL